MVSLLTILISYFLAQQYVARAEISINIPSSEIKIRNGGRIIGGEDATNIDIPWMVSLVMMGKHFCGGSIISRRTIVTAAHCLVFANKRFLKVRVGSKDRFENGLLLQIEDFVIHNDFSHVNYQRDIGLVFLKKNLQYVPKIIEAVDLPESDSFVEDGTMAMVSGWGILRHNSNVSPRILQYVMVPVINRETCNLLMNNLINNDQLCAGFFEGGKDACQQDSGGPLVADKKLIGIVSWGDECGKPRRPGVYTDVSALRNWVDKHMK